MESFSQKLKSELVALPIESYKATYYELYSLLLFAIESSSGETILLPPENSYVTSRILHLIKFLPLKEPKKSIKIKYYSELNPIEKSISIPQSMNFDSIKSTDISDLFIHAFLRGIFLFCGSVVNPENEYHLELCINSGKLKDFTLEIIGKLENVDFGLKLINRRNAYVLYSKSAEQIIDFLVFIGAKNCAMELIQIKMLKKVRNDVNRTTNFETANIAKITNSSSVQIEAIKKLKKLKKINELPDSLKEIADLRMENPYSSLEDLANKTKDKLSKSGVNHRLRKIVKIAESLA
ncbi:MAG: DNA-binding protein WhiA [Clostridia bacterium]|nr:DNA-binding protein WhiA [Clostridia bacterium]